MKLKPNVKKRLKQVFVALFIIGTLFYLTRPIKTEKELLGDEYYRRFACLSPFDKIELNQLKEEQKLELIVVSGDHDKELEIEEKYKDKENEFYQQLFYKNQKRFKVYYDKIKQTETTHPEVWKDPLFFQEYVQFQTHVENDRFSEAESSLLLLESKLNISFLNS